MGEELERRFLRAAQGGELSLAAAFSIAKEANVSVKKVGELRDKLKIKIRACQLGCFS